MKTSENRRAYYQANRERMRQQHREYYARTRETSVARAAAYREKNRELLRQKALEYHHNGRGKHYARAALLDKYSLTVTEYEAMLASQDGRCAICGSPPGKKLLVVDHDHSDGTVRGLLCDRCNRALGFFKDSDVLVRRALDYLEAHD